MHRIALSMLFPLYLRYAVKVGIAGAISYTVSDLLGSPYAAWAVVSAVIAMQMNVAESLHIGMVRLIGTVVGAAVGAALLLLTPKTPFWVGAAMCSMTMVFAFLTRYSTTFNAMSVAGVIVLLSGALYSKNGYSEAYGFALLRVLEIAVGVGSALGVSVLLWPVKLVDTLRTDLSLQCIKCSETLDRILKSFLAGQEHLPYTVLHDLEDSVWQNHARLASARKHESFLYSYKHEVMDIQISALDRTVESLRAMLEALNDYDEQGRDPHMAHELRVLGDAVMAALRHIGSDRATQPAPDLIRGLTGGVGAMETRLSELRSQGVMHTLELHKVLQFYAFFQSMRLLAESLLIALDRLEAHAGKADGK